MQEHEIEIEIKNAASTEELIERLNTQISLLWREIRALKEQLRKIGIGSDPLGEEISALWRRLHELETSLEGHEGEPY